jgi:hypothetical protein
LLGFFKSFFRIFIGFFQLLDKRTFQGEMEVSGRIEVEPQENWTQMRLKSVSTEDLKKELTKVKEDQRAIYFLFLAI